MSPMSVSSRRRTWNVPADRHAHAFASGRTVIFDYGVPAELFMPKAKRGGRQSLGYRPFTTAADAICFAVEQFPAVRTLGAWMQVGDERFSGDEIRQLYESSDYPLTRRASE
jgi:hypothetical protein